MVVEKKDKSLRLCLDPKPLNSAILRERFVIPTPADVQSQLAGKRVFSVIDMKDGYWHVGLTEASSYLTTFHTPWGRKRFLRMPFGICSASEVMQKRNESAFGDIRGVHIIADDIIVAAKDDNEHDQILLALFNRAKEMGVRFNEKKIQFKVNSVQYIPFIPKLCCCSSKNSKFRICITFGICFPKFQKQLSLDSYHGNGKLLPHGNIGKLQQKYA